MRAAGTKKAAFSLKTEAISPPNKSTSQDYEIVHDEALALQCIARRRLEEILLRNAGEYFEWLLFVNEATPYKKLKNNETVTTFIRSKIRKR